MNKGWPSLLWNLYGSDGDQAGSYFGAQEANRPLHALYALDNGTVTLDNLGNATQSGLTVRGQGVQRHRRAARRPGRQRHHAGQPAGQGQGAHPGGAEGRQRPGAGLLRGTAAEPARDAGRPQRVLAVHPAGRDELAADTRQPRRGNQPRTPTCTALRTLARRQYRPPRPPGGKPGRTGPTWRPRSPSGTRRRPPSRSCCGPTSGAAPPAAGNCQGTTSSSPPPGRTTTSRCSPASRRR